MVLWRFDQGRGTKIFDLTEHQNNGKILYDKAPLAKPDSQYIWEHGELQSGSPLLFEDEWGKECPPNYALKFNGKESIRIRGSQSLSKFNGHFTFQIWLNIESSDEFENNNLDITVSTNNFIHL